MTGFAVTIVESGGVAVTAVENAAPSAVAVDSGGIAVTLVESGGLPLVVSAPPALPLGLGVYNGNDLEAVEQFDTWLERPARWQQVYFNQTSWGNFASSIDFVADLFAGMTCLWNVPLAAEYGTIPDVADGDHDALFLACAQAIVAAAPAGELIWVRTGWEFNLLGQEQRAFDVAETPNPIPETWVTAYQRVVGIFRGVSNRYRFIWCPNQGAEEENGLNVFDCWPGDDYVDAVGLDLYYFGDPDNGQFGSDTWDFFRTQGCGADALRDFAALHEIPFCFPEYGWSDDGATGFAADHCAYIRDPANNCGLHGYWNSAAAYDGILSDDSKPALAEVYKRYFGRPLVTTSATSDSAEEEDYEIALTSNQDDIVGLTVTWELVSGAATLEGSTLTVTSAAAGEVEIVVTATNSDGLVSDPFEITHTFTAPHVFVNAEAEAYVARMGTQPTESRKALIDDLFSALKSGAISSSNILAKLDVLDIFAAHAADAALLNAKTNANDPTATGSPVFTTDRGYEGNPGYIESNRNANASGNYQQNSASFGVWVLNNGAQDNPATGVSGQPIELRPRNSSNQAILLINDWTNLTVGSITDSRGLWAGNRSASNAKQFYHNGSSIGSASTTSETRPATEFLICTGTTAFPGEWQIAIFFSGASLSANEHLDLYNALLAYLQGVGAVA